MTGASAQDRARQLVDDLAGQGAVFSYRAPSGALPRLFTYELPRGGDRRACRLLIIRAKGDSALWSAVLAEVKIRCGVPA